MLWQKIRYTSKEKPVSISKIYNSVGQVYGNWIHPYYNKEEGPFFEFPDINNKIEDSEKQQAKTTNKAYEWAWPDILIYRESKIPYLADHH